MKDYRVTFIYEDASWSQAMVSAEDMHKAMCVVWQNLDMAGCVQLQIGEDKEYVCN